MLHNNMTVWLCCCCNKGRGKVEDDPADDASKPLITDEEMEKKTADGDNVTLDSLVPSPRGNVNENHRKTIGDIEVHPDDISISDMDDCYPTLKFSRKGSIGETPIDAADLRDSIANDDFFEPVPDALKRSEEE
jgi:hypothetical protein